jgi:hypothetical protein
MPKNKGILEYWNIGNNHPSHCSIIPLFHNSRFSATGSRL